VGDTPFRKGSIRIGIRVSVELPAAQITPSFWPELTMEAVLGLHMQTELVDGLIFVILVVLVSGVVWALYKLGGLPGRIARSRRHPKAAAIGVCGWLGLAIFVLWPIALAWAYMTPKERRRQLLTETEEAAVRRETRKEQQHGTPTEEDLDVLIVRLRETSEQIATLKNRLNVQKFKTRDKGKSRGHFV
jgi:hypothetical protein